MAKQTFLTAGAVALGLSLLGCDRDEVKDEVQDLKEAQQNAPNVAGDLQEQLKQAKAEVVRLEEKLALAKQGVTDEVEEERRELKEAVQQEQQQVNEEVKEAKGAAQEHSAATEQARQQLEKTPPVQPVEARVKTETQKVPSGTTDVEIKTQQQNIPVERARVVERRTETRTTTPDQGASTR